MPNIKHQKVSDAGPASNPDLVGGDDWNEEHVVDEFVDYPSQSATPGAPTGAVRVYGREIGGVVHFAWLGPDGIERIGLPATNGAASGLTLVDGYTEEVFAVTGTTPALSPANGSIQTWTLSGASTPTAGTWTAGQSITLMIDDGSANTINWTSLAVTWKTDGGSAPTLNTSGYTVVALWKVGTTIYGARVGDA